MLLHKEIYEGKVLCLHIIIFHLRPPPPQCKPHHKHDEHDIGSTIYIYIYLYMFEEKKEIFWCVCLGHKSYFQDDESIKKRISKECSIVESKIFNNDFHIFSHLTIASKNKLYIFLALKDL